MDNLEPKHKISLDKQMKGMWSHHCYYILEFNTHFQIVDIRHLLLWVVRGAITNDMNYYF
jgi:hypothetical protein